MSFVEQIQETESCIAFFISELKMQKIPLLFYGAGQTANYFYNLLTDNQILPESVVVDDQYYKENSFFNGQKIYSLSSKLAEHPQLNVFIAFTTCQGESLKQFLRGTSKVNNIYAFDDPAIFNGIKEFYSYSHIIENIQFYEGLYNTLADDLSKQVMVNFINQRISDKTTYLESVWTKDDYDPKGLFLYGQNETFVDCGAYDGDTIKLFLKNLALHGGNYSRLIAFEPDSKNFQKLKSLEPSLANLSCLNKGAWSHKDTLKFSNSGTMSSGISATEGISVAVESIDNVLSGEPVTYIKMDIEGAELAALKGAKASIIKYQPKLAICVYHKKDDLLTIPQYIKELVPEYRLYLRAHRPFSKELVLYACR